MKEYYVCVSTSEGWDRIKEFRLGVPFYEPNEKLSYFEANQRQGELARKHPDHKFIFIEAGLYNSLNS